MAYVEMLRITSGVGMLAAAGFNTVVFATKFSGTTPEQLALARQEATVEVPAGSSPGGRIDVTFPSGSRGVINVPAGLAAGQQFRVKPPKTESDQQSPEMAMMRGGLIGMSARLRIQALFPPEKHDILRHFAEG